MTKKTFIENLSLENYRNFKEVSFNFGDKINIIVGANGSGKTNILESLSLLTTGKGLKSNNFDEICNVNESSWQTHTSLQSKLGKASIEMIYEESSRGRKIKYNGNKIASNELANFVNILWLTPQMEGIFIGSASQRRRFLDRIVYNFDPNHPKELNKYAHFTKERTGIMQEHGHANNDSWLNNLENEIAICANQITKKRLLAISYMEDAISKLREDFPKADLELITDISPNDNYLDLYQEKLSLNREKDFFSKRTNFGVHKDDLQVIHKQTQMPSSLCSTGEQKALLITLTLASVEAVTLINNAKPILLLDELFVHLDNDRKKSLSNYIIDTKIQTFITTTDMMGIEHLTKKAEIINL